MARHKELAQPTHELEYITKIIYCLQNKMTSKKFQILCRSCIFFLCSAWINDSQLLYGAIYLL